MVLARFPRRGRGGYRPWPQHRPSGRRGSADLPVAKIILNRPVGLFRMIKSPVGDLIPTRPAVINGQLDSPLP